MGGRWSRRPFLGDRHDIRSNGTTVFSGRGSVIKFSSTQGDTWDNLDKSGLPTDFSAIWIEPTATELYILGTSGGSSMLFKRALNQISLTPTMQFAIEPVAGFTLVNDGRSFSSTSLARGQNLTYQWLRNGNPIPGQTNATLNIPSVTPADAGLITVRVTGTDRTITSANVIELKVVPSTPGNQDVSFRQTSLPRGGSCVLLDDFTVVQVNGSFNGSFITRYAEDGTELARRQEDPTLLLRRGFVDSRGKLVMFGAKSVIRTNPADLSNDVDFTPASFVFGVGSNIAIISDVIELPGKGYLVAMGSKASLRGTNVPVIALLDYSGNYNPVFDIGLKNFTSNFPGGMRLSLDGAGRIIAAGGISRWPDANLSAHQTSGVVRLFADGSRDFTFNLNPGFQIYLARAMRDGRVLYAAQVGAERMGRALENGAVDTGFGSAGTNFDRSILDFVEEPTGKIIVTGEFKNFGASPTRGYARLNADGTLDTGFDSIAGFVSGASDQDIKEVCSDPRGFAYLVPESGLGQFRSNRHSGLTRVFSDKPPLFLWRQTAAQKVLIGSPLTLSANVTGTSVISYQWFKNGIAIAGQTASSLNFPVFSAANAGTYTVVATNASGSMTSKEMVISIAGPPTIVSLTEDQNLLVGGNLSLTVIVDGASPLTYQWKKDGTPIAGEIAPVLEISNIQIGNAETYTVVVTNSLGTITSDTVIVEVNEITGLAKPGFNAYNLNGSVYSLSVLPDKSYVVGGVFSNPSQHRNYTRLLSNGSLATGAWISNPPGGTNTTVRTTAISRDKTKVYIGGDFSTIGSTSVKYIARLNLDGTLDSTFTSPTFSRIPRILKIEELPNGQIMIAGIINEFGGLTRYHIARLNNDGSLDTTFAHIPDSDVNDFAILGDGSIILAGLFTQVDGAPRSRIAKLLPDGSLDPSFSPPVLSNQLLSIAVQADGKILIGGDFLNLNVGGKNYNYLARLMPNGSVDTTFPDTDNPTGTVRAVHIQADGRIVVGGTGVRRLLPSGESDPFFQRSTSGTVYALDSTPDGCLYIGSFSGKGSGVLTTTSTDLAISTSPQGKLADLGGSATFGVTYFSKTPPSFQWRKNGIPIAGAIGETFTVTNITRADAGTYSVTITNATKTVSSNPARLIVLAEPVVTTQPSAQQIGKGGVLDLSVAAVGAGTLSYQWKLNGNVIAGATSATLNIPSVDFVNSGCYQVVVTNSLGSVISHPGAVAVQEIAGTLDGLALQGAGAYGVSAIAELPNGNIAIGGSFTSIGGFSRSRFAVLNNGGTVQNLPTNFSSTGTIVDLAAQPDGKIVYTAQNGWGRINANGTLDNSFPTGTNFAGACLVDGNSVYICAAFPGGASASAVRKFNLASGVEDTAFATNSRLPNGVSGLFLMTFVKLPNGNFACGSNSGQIAVLQADGTPLPGFTNPIIPGSGRLIEDFVPTAGGKMFVVGSFSNQGSPGVHNSILRANADGTIDGSFVSQAGSALFRAGVANGDGSSCLAKA